MADSDITFSGLWNLGVGSTVQCSIAGLDCGDFTVDAFGRIVVPIDSHPSLSAGYIAQVSARGLDVPNLASLTLGDQLYIVPVVIGKKFTTKGQGLRAIDQQDLRVKVGPGVGMMRRGHQYAFLLTTSKAPEVGTDFTTMYDAKLRLKDGVTAWPETSGYSGVTVDVLEDAHGTDTMLAWRLDRPGPLIINAATTFLAAEER